jgi:nitrogen PTS system EIIA component
MYNANDLLLEGHAFARGKVKNKKQAISDLTQRMAAALKLDARALAEAVHERERLGSTGIGEGVAIPHARMEGVGRAVASVLVLEEPIGFDAIDGNPCDIIVLLLAPVSASAEHLRALAKLSRALRQPETRQAVRAARNSSQLALALNGRSQPDAA